ncbi:MAG: GcvT family protein, partial [Methyloligellaceae bacterium]
VVLAAGLWSRDIGARAGIEIPVFACEHFYLLTKPIEGITGHLPTLGDHDGYIYLRDEVGGLLAGCFEPKGKPIGTEALPKDFEFDLFDEDWDHFEPMMLNAMHRIPALEEAEARTLLNGPESFTPDGHPIVGETAELPGFYLACGLNSAGVACGGGVGRAIAQWVMADESPMDLLDVDASRFHALENRVPGLDARVGEVLSLHYAIAYPGREHETARDLRHLPLHEMFAERGARFGQRYGAERALYIDSKEMSDHALTYAKPAWFDHVEAECHAARSSVALFDESLFGKILVEGRDAESLLQRCSANDMGRAPGRIVYTTMLNSRGGIESDLTAMRLSETSYLLYTGALSADRDMTYLRRQLRAEDDVSMTKVTDQYAILAVMGPSARALLQCLTDADLSNASFPYFTHQMLEIAGRRVRAARLSYVGELGWELSAAAEDAPYILTSLLDAGGPYGFRLAGAYAMNALRIEKQYLSFGHDIGPDVTPLEADLGFAVTRKSGLDFAGRAALET